MPPGTGEEVRDLFQLQFDAALVVTAPQRISESAAQAAVHARHTKQSRILRTANTGLRKRPARPGGGAGTVPM